MQINIIKIMEILNDIIKDLLDEDTSLTSALLKTKYFASKIKNVQLLDWVNNELNGYKHNKDLPDYRIVICHVYGSYLNGNTHVKEQILPVHELNEKYKFRFDETYFKDNISSLEDLIKSKGNNKLSIPFNSELLGAIEKHLISLGNPYLQLFSAHQYIPKTVITNIIFQTKNVLLEFMLKIDSDYGDVTDFKVLISKSKEIEKIMSNTIINNYGDGNISNTGNDTIIDAVINISKNDPQKLQEELLKKGVDQNDIDELITVIDNDNHDIDNKKFGSSTNEWFTKMIGKALDGSWNITTSVAAGVLTEIINQYLGII